MEFDNQGELMMAHPYPLLISANVQRLLTGSIFYYAIFDVAAGNFFASGTPAITNIQRQFLDSGTKPETWETNLSCFYEFITEYPKPIFQNVVFLMQAHWDWYISRIAEFVKFAREYIPEPFASNKVLKEFKSFDRLPILSQLHLLEIMTGLDFPIPTHIRASIKEMSLVRNLGIHNLWHIDNLYLNNSLNKKWKKGEIRNVSIDELEEWRDSINVIIGMTAQSIALYYQDVSEFNPNS